MHDWPYQECTADGGGTQALPLESQRQLFDLDLHLAATEQMLNALHWTGSS